MCEIYIISEIISCVCQSAAEARGTAETELGELKTEVDGLNKEQEDLLVLLTEQDTKMKAYRTRLKELGEKVRWLAIRNTGFNIVLGYFAICISFRILRVSLACFMVKTIANKT